MTKGVDTQDSERNLKDIMVKNVSLGIAYIDLFAGVVCPQRRIL